MTASNTLNVMDFYVIEGGICASEEIQIVSDRRMKNSIDYDMDKYVDFYMGLKPSSFKMKYGNSGRLHTGFIAQDVEDAIRNSGLTTNDFAGLVISSVKDIVDEKEVEEDHYKIRYGEFISLNTYMIQKLYRRIEELEKLVKMKEV